MDLPLDSLHTSRHEAVEMVDFVGEDKEEDDDDGGFSLHTEAREGLRRGKPTLLPP